MTPARSAKVRTLAEFSAEVRTQTATTGNCWVLDIEEERLWFTAHHWLAGQEWCCCEQVRKP